MRGAGDPHRAFHEGPAGGPEVRAPWVELAPNSLQARQALAHLLLQEGDLAGTRRELNALLEVAQARGEDGFLLAAAVLGGEHRTPHGLELLAELAMPSRVMRGASTRWR